MTFNNRVPFDSDAITTDSHSQKPAHAVVSAAPGARSRRPPGAPSAWVETPNLTTSMRDWQHVDGLADPYNFFHFNDANYGEEVMTDQNADEDADEDTDEDADDDAPDDGIPEYPGASLVNQRARHMEPPEAPLPNHDKQRPAEENAPRAKGAKRPRINAPSKCTLSDCNCGKIFKKANQLKRHQDTRSGKFVCTDPKCADDQGKLKAFGSKNDLQRHSREKHGKELNGDPSTQYYCLEESCPRKDPFWRKANWDQHMDKRHPGMRQIYSEAPVHSESIPGPSNPKVPPSALGATKSRGIRRRREVNSESDSEESNEKAMEKLKRLKAEKLVIIEREHHEVAMIEIRLEEREKALKLEKRQKRQRVS